MEEKDLNIKQAENDINAEEMIINMGPQHPSTHGVLRLVIQTDGEIVTSIVPHVGYLHRGLEKIGEKLFYPQFMPYTDRIDYLASMNCNFAYAEAVERLAGIEIPERAQYLRVIFAELNRIASHLVFFGTCALDLGAFTPLLYAFRERELILDLFEMTCGARLTYNYGRIGGVSADIPAGFKEKCVEFCAILKKKLKEYDDLLTYNRIFIERTAKIGVINAEEAIEYSLGGPNVRGSGIMWDLRKNEPYWCYDKFEFDVPVGIGGPGVIGDCWNRYYVRVQEMRESVKIIEQAIETIPEGDFATKVPKVFKPEAGEIYVRTENPRGEIGFYIISDGSRNPSRLKIRTSSFTAVGILPLIGENSMLSDLVAIIGSLDVVLPEIDR